MEASSIEHLAYVLTSLKVLKVSQLMKTVVNLQRFLHEQSSLI